MPVMTAQQPTSTAPMQAPLSIHFIVIGGGISGLSAAIALRRVGHEVTVLEKGDGRTNRGYGGVRMAPNMSKILFHWGLRDKLLQVAAPSKPLLFSKFETGEVLGTQLWSDELLAETRGQFMCTTHAELVQFFYESAVAHGAKIRLSTEVSEIDPEEVKVTLSTGEVLTGDVIIGADGERGLCRRLVLGRPERVTSSGVTLYDTIYSTDRVMQGVDEELAQLCALEDNTVFVAFGAGRAATGYPVHKRKDIAFHIFIEDEGTEGVYGDPPSGVLRRVMKMPCDPRLYHVAQNCAGAVRIAINLYEDLEDWVHDSGPLVVIGQAAHPIVPGTVHGASMTVEDGAVLAKLFARLRNRDQIESFLYAFQDLRQQRCRDTVKSEISLMQLFILEDCPEREARDNDMRAKFREGKGALELEDGEEPRGLAGQQWNEIRDIFGYDCEDEADNWWVQWGLLRERARSSAERNGVQEVQSSGFSWDSISFQNTS